MLRRSATQLVRAERERLSTGPLPNLPSRSLRGPKTLESRILPGLFLLAFVSLLVIQVFIAL